MSKKRKYYSPEEKISILKQHLVNGVAVSDLCDQYELQPTVFYRWQRQLFARGAAAFQAEQNRENVRLKQQITRLEEKVTRKNEVLGKLMEEHIALKKELGSLKKQWVSPKVRDQVVGLFSDGFRTLL